ncbi:MAG: hypothetical protein ACR2OO_17720 [Thermomicrobiales bacterium]
MLAALLLVVAGAAADSAKIDRESRVTVPLSAVGGSGVKGVATFVRADGVTVVKVAITGVGGDRYLPDIRSGTCAHAAAMPDVPLSIVDSGAASATTIDLSVPDLFPGPHVVMIHSASPAVTSLDAGSAVACGRILRRKVRAAPTPTPGIAVAAAPRTGIGPMVGAGGEPLILPLAGAGVAAASAGLLLKRRMRSGGLSPLPIGARTGHEGGTP